MRNGLIDEKTLHEALEKQKTVKKRLGEILIEEKLISEQQLLETLSHEYQLPVVDPSNVKIEDRLIRMFPYQFLSHNKALPLYIEDDALVVALNDPLDLAVLQELRNLSGLKIKPVLANLGEVEKTLQKYFRPFHSAEEAIREIVVQKGKQPSEAREPSSEDLEIAAQDAPTVRFVSSIIGEAIKENASDIHFEPQRETLRVRFRIDGVLHEKMTVPKEMQAAVISRIKVISGMDIAERRKPQDGRMTVSEENRELDIRVSTLPDIFGEKAVLRLLDKKSIALSLESLGMFPDELHIIQSLINRPYGMILVTGPTGSGKTTTLYSILNTLNETTRNIVTVEDPVEYELNGINQTSINVRAGYTFANAIRYILRQDPDVIMIGEIRDLETAEIAIQAALTGHLVLSTIHTNNAPGAITRLIDMNVEPFLITSAVIGVIAQRLVRKLCPFCKQEYIPSAAVKESVPELRNLETAFLAGPGGCEKCYALGYTGRTALFEMFAMVDDIRKLVLQKPTETEIAKLALAHGMRTLRAAGVRKCGEKITSLEEVMRITFAEKE